MGCKWLLFLTPAIREGYLNTCVAQCVPAMIDRGVLKVKSLGIGQSILLKWMEEDE